MEWLTVIIIYAVILVHNGISAKKTAQPNRKYNLTRLSVHRKYYNKTPNLMQRKRFANLHNDIILSDLQKT